MTETDTKTEETYLGDGVYAMFDGYHIVLLVPAGSSENGREQVIAIEPQVMDRLRKFAEDVGI